jgi:hypothetical protein
MMAERPAASTRRAWPVMSQYINRAGDLSWPLFRDPAGAVYDAFAIRRDLLAMGRGDLRGKPLRQQLAEASPMLLKAFEHGSTPWQLPPTLF